MTEGAATVPDRFVTAVWTEIFKTHWDDQTRRDRKVIFDRAVALWWNPTSIAPGRTREIVT